jgi:hypothetical protein
MERRLLPLNALLGLLTPKDINPARLTSAGFRLEGLEIPAVGEAGKVVIDALLFHELTNHLVACESKSGANVKEPQAKSYAALTAQKVVQAASVSLKQKNRQPTLEILYVCTADNVDRIRLGLRTLELDFPVLSIGGLRLELHDSEHASEILRDPFVGGLVLDAPPPRVIPFDAESPQNEITGPVMAAMVAMMAQKIAQISLTSLTEKAAPHYGLYGHAAQQKLKGLVAEVVRGMVAKEPDRYAFDRAVGHRQEAVVRFLRTPEDFKPRGRTQGYQAIGRAGKAATQPTPDYDLLDLLRELELGENDEEDLDTAEGEGGQR